MGEPSSAPPPVNRARGTTGSPRESQRILTPDDERAFTELVTLHAKSREAFEARYGRGTWLSMTGTVQNAARLLAMQRAQDDRFIEAQERARGVLEVNRERQAAQELASYNRGVEAIKASGVGAVTGAVGLGVASERGANVHELADVAEATTQAGDMAALLVAMGRGRGRAAAPPPGAGGASRAGGAPSPENKKVSNKGTSPTERGVPQYPTVVEPERQPPANENKMGRPANDNSLRSPADAAVPRIQPRPVQPAVPVEAAAPLKKTGTEDMRVRAARGGRREPPRPPRTPPGQPVPPSAPGPSPPTTRPWDVAGREHLPQGRGPGRGSLRKDGTGFSPDELAPAEWARDQGIDVVLRKPHGTRAGGGTTDTILNSQLWDVYTPDAGTPMAKIIDTMAGKATQVGRGSGGVLVNLNKSQYTPAQLQQHLLNARRKGNTPLRSLRKWVAIKQQ